MSDNYWESKKVSSGGVVLEQDKASGLAQFMTQIYTWMALGLAITGFLAMFTANSQAMTQFIFQNTFVFMFLLIAEIGMVIAFSVSLRKGASATALLTMFLTYSALNGLTLSAIFLVYTAASITQTFFIAAGMFGGMSLYGYVTKKDLTGFGSFAIMGLWGLILASIVNIFWRNSTFSWMISLIGVGLFVILTAYDTQKLKQYYYTHGSDAEQLKRISLGGALTLYLDFINLFLFLLRFLGKRR